MESVSKFQRFYSHSIERGRQGGWVLLNRYRFPLNFLNKFWTQYLIILIFIYDSPKRYDKIIHGPANTIKGIYPVRFVYKTIDWLLVYLVCLYALRILLHLICIVFLPAWSKRGRLRLLIILYFNSLSVPKIVMRTEMNRIEILNLNGLGNEGGCCPL